MGTDQLGSSYAVDISGLRVSFAQPDKSSATILDDVDFRVNRGEFVVLVGRSGGGKTTLLNVVAGLVQPAAGEVRVLGGDIDSARRQMGFMFARDALLPWRTAQRNVEYPLELHRVPRRRRAEIAAEQLRRVHLEGHEKRWPWQLSQGMRQRVALARTWAPNPQLLLMDEPFAALDSQTRNAIRTDFVQQWRESGGTTVIFVTHDLVEAAVLGQRIFVIDGGIRREVRPTHQQGADEADLADDPDYLECLRTLREAIGVSSRQGAPHDDH